MRAWWCIAMLLLAGCSGTGDDPVGNAPPRADPATPTAWPVQATATIGPEANSSPLVGNLEGYTRLLLAPPDASIVAFDIDIGEAPGVLADVLWSVECLALVGCSKETEVAAGRGALPLAIAVDNLSVTAGAELWLRLREAGTGPETYYSHFTGLTDPAITGTVWTVPAQAHPTRVVVIERSFDGITSPCVYPTDAECFGVPGGTEHFFSGIQGRAVAAEITMTWTATTPAEAELGVHIECGDPYNTCNDLRAYETIGTSPLVLNVTMHWEGPVATIEAFHPWGGEDRRLGLRTPVHFDVRVWDLRVAEPEEGDGRKSRDV